MALQPERIYTTEDIYALPDGQRAELIDGQIYDMAPFAVFLNEDDRNYVEPDISVICDNNKLDDKGCHGAPDWIIEITSPSTSQIDYGIKLFKYRSAGVREYWVINPKTRIVNVFDFEHEQGSDQYSFDDDIPVCLYNNLNICISAL